MGNESMFQRCDKLRIELDDKCKMSDRFDTLCEYRRWWDMQNIKSEGEDGWPLPFCFDQGNILKFVEYWLGRENDGK